MTLASTTPTLDKILLLVLVAVCLYGGVLYWRNARRRNRDSFEQLADHIERQPPRGRIAREVAAAISDQAYAPYGADLLDRPTPGPVPAAGEIDPADYVARALAHVPCQASQCSHKPWPGQHCRTCDLPYPCPLSGPLNSRLIDPSHGQSHFDEDKRAFQREWRDTGRW